MLKKMLSLAIAAALGPVLPAAESATKSDAPLEMAKAQNPASELQCLEAFIDSRFEYAHRLCLILAQQGMVDAQLVTGLMYAAGEGTEKNAELARLWLNEALRNGSDEAREALVEFNLLD